MAPAVQLFLLSTMMMLAVAQHPERKNPFLVQQRARHQHLQQQKNLRQVQEQHQKVDLEFKPVQQQSQPQQQQQPSGPKDKTTTRQEWGAPKTQVQQSPFNQHDSTAGQKSTPRPRRNHGVHSHNRNEMHKTGGSTWSRYTDKPRQQNPWGDKATKHETADCRGKAYNPREHICCQGEIHKRQGLRPACCGSVAFDFVFNLCCDNKVTPRTSGRPFC